MQLTESEKLALVNCYMDKKAYIEHMLTYNSKPNLNPEDYLKSYISDQYITIEEVSLPIAGSPLEVNSYSLILYICICR